MTSHSASSGLISYTRTIHQLGPTQYCRQQGPSISWDPHNVAIRREPRPLVRLSPTRTIQLSGHAHCCHQMKPTHIHRLRRRHFQAYLFNSSCLITNPLLQEVSNKKSVILINEQTQQSHVQGRPTSTKGNSQQWVFKL